MPLIIEPDATATSPLGSGEAIAHNSILLKTLQTLARRKLEGLRYYLPLPLASRFHACNTKFRIGDGSNRSSKTMTCCVEACRAWLGCDPYDKYVRKNGNSLVVGLDGDHLSMFWRKCAEPGAFSLIPDQDTGLLRSVRPDPQNPLHLDPYDEAYKEKWRDAPPLIPPRLIRRIAWEFRAKGIPRVVEFKGTDWRVLFRSSEGKPPLGDHYHLVAFDEHLTNNQFYYEAVRGITALGESAQHKPKFIWTATAQAFSPELGDLREAADAGSEHIAGFLFLIADNPYISDEEKQAFYESLPEEERQVRYFGQYAAAQQRVYPLWDRQGVHGCEPYDVPRSHTRFVVLDPGQQHCATIFLAVDPQEAFITVYDGFDLRNIDAAEWAHEIGKRQGDIRFEAFIVDQQMGQEHPPAAGLNIAQQYFGALQDANIRPRVESGGRWGGFFPGSNDVAARSEALLGLMRLRTSGPFSGKPKLRVFRDIIPELDRQIKNARMVFNQAKIRRRQGTKRAEQQEDLLVALEYAAAFGPYYHEPESINEKPKNPVWDQYQKKCRRRRMRQMQNDPGVVLGRL